MFYIECLLAWLFLIKGLLTNDSILLIASGVFAIAQNCKRKGD